MKTYYLIKKVYEELGFHLKKIKFAKLKCITDYKVDSNTTCIC